MKKLLQPATYKYFFLTFLLATLQVIVNAQDSTIASTSTTSTTTTTERTWFTEPWVWVVGGIILLILIIALTRGSGRTDRVTVTKTRTVD